MQKHFLNVLAFQNFLIEKIVETLEGKMEDLQAEIETLEGEMEDLRAEIETLEGEMEDLRAETETLEGEMEDLRAETETLEGEKVKVKETLTLLKEIAKPGEYGSLEQRAWDIYHDLKHLVER